MTADFVAIPDEAALASWPEDACSTLRRFAALACAVTYGVPPVSSRLAPAGVGALQKRDAQLCDVRARERRSSRSPSSLRTPAPAVRAQLLRTTRPLRHHRCLYRVTDTRRLVSAIHPRFTRARRAYHLSHQELCGALQSATTPFDRLDWRAALCGVTFSPTLVLAVVARLPPRKL
ncbi:hypothetical protein K525DRAFT_274879 [Schizophyllum commune Loenen D]|nr:hypothetical protein K525DRAFT_274879 [Schizophyllum commune Loenen D]